MVVGIVSVHRLLRATRFDPKPYNGCDLRLPADMQLLLALPVRVVAREHLVRYAEENWVDGELSACIGFGQDAVCALGCRGEEARWIHAITVERRLEVGADLLAQLLGHKILDNERTISFQNGLQRFWGDASIGCVDSGELLASLSRERLAGFVLRAA